MTQQPAISSVPPQNVDLEMAVLGGIMLEPQEAYPLAAELLSRESFYLDGHGILFDIMGDLYRRGMPPDVQSVLDELRARNMLEKVGGSGVVMGMLNTVPTAANVVNHARKVAEKAQLRRIQRTAMNVLTKIDQGAMESSELVARSVATLQKIDRQGARAGVPQAVEHKAKEYLERYIQRAAQADEDVANGVDASSILSGLSTGLSDIDKSMNGLRASELIVIAGRTSHGKSALMLNVADHIARQDIPAGYISLEMGLDQLMPRLASAETHRMLSPYFVDIDGCDNPATVTPWYRNKVQQAYHNIQCRRNATLWIVDDCPRSFNSVMSSVRRLIQDNGCQIVFIDYLQLMRFPGFENRTLELGEMTSALKEAARLFKVPLIIGSQLKRPESAALANMQPDLSHLRESGSIEQDADSVWFVWPVEAGASPKQGYPSWTRPKQDDPGRDNRAAAAGDYQENEANAPPMPIDGQIIIAKNRNGPTGGVPIRFLPECTRFLSATWRAA